MYIAPLSDHTLSSMPLVLIIRHISSVLPRSLSMVILFVLSSMVTVPIIPIPASLPRNINLRLFIALSSIGFLHYGRCVFHPSRRENLLLGGIAYPSVIGGHIDHPARADPPVFRVEFHR